LGLDDEVVRTVDWWELDRTVTPDHLTSIYIPALKSPINVGSELSALEELVLTLRARCPWDRAQTHASLMPHLIEESYEVLDALAAISSTDGMATAPDFAHLKEELGDLLFQIVFHSRLAQEEGEFTLADVARGVHEKLVHRHPHVFGGVEADTPDQVVANWEAIKKDEKGRSSVTDGIPAHLPSLMLASKLQRKAGSVGMLSSSEAFDLPQRLAELQALASSAANESADAPLAPDVTSTEVLVGDLLFDVTDLARRVGVDAEQALRSRALSYRDQIVETEASKQSPE
jgi:tetrapyrrole methylase family protein/MazG family protein